MTTSAILSVASPVLVSGIASALAAAQAPSPFAGRVVSGDDVGFRVDGSGIGGTPTGSLVIRMNNQWVEVNVSQPAAPRLLR